MNIIKLAKKAGFFLDGDNNLCCGDRDGVCTEELERFFAIVRADALEEAAKVCDDMDNESSWKRNSVNCAAAIRGIK